MEATFFYFLRVSLTVFSALLIPASLYFYVYPKKYWAMTKRGLAFRGITGSKPSKRYYTYVKISSLFQILLGVLLLIYVFIGMDTTVFTP